MAVTMKHGKTKKKGKKERKTNHFPSHSLQLMMNFHKTERKISVPLLALALLQLATKEKVNMRR